MKSLESLLEAVLANVVASLVLVVVVAIVGAVLGQVVFGRNYKQRIAALEARLSQPTVVNNVYTGNKSATEITGDVTEIRALTQAEYDALPKKNQTTLYLIVDER